MSGRDDEFNLFSIAALNQMLIDNQSKDLGMIRIKSFDKEGNPPVVVCCYCGCFQ